MGGNLSFLAPPMEDRIALAVSGRLAIAAASSVASGPVGSVPVSSPVCARVPGVGLRVWLWFALAVGLDTIGKVFA